MVAKQNGCNQKITLDIILRLLVTERFSLYAIQQKLACLFFSDEREGEAADPSGVPLVQVLGSGEGWGWG